MLPRRVEHVTHVKRVAQGAREPERDEPSVRHAVRSADADAHGLDAELARGALLRGRRAGEDQPVSVHARLRTVSFMLFDDSNAAEGSKPEWMPQCSQRESLPGP